MRSRLATLCAWLMPFLSNFELPGLGLAHCRFCPVDHAWCQVSARLTWARLVGAFRGRGPAAYLRAAYLRPALPVMESLAQAERQRELQG